MRADDASQLRRLARPSEGGKLLNIVAVGAPSFDVGDVGEPFELGRNFGEVAELGERETAVFEWYAVGQRRTLTETA
jgi:hypothetical protein